jgi:hypothetical protein
VYSMSVSELGASKPGSTHVMRCVPSPSTTTSTGCTVDETYSSEVGSVSTTVISPVASAYSLDSTRRPQTLSRPWLVTSSPARTDLWIETSSAVTT